MFFETKFFYIDKYRSRWYWWVSRIIYCEIQSKLSSKVNDTNEGLYRLTFVLNKRWFRRLQRTIVWTKFDKNKKEKKIKLQASKILRYCLEWSFLSFLLSCSRESYLTQKPRCVPKLFVHAFFLNIIFFV